MRLGHSHPVGNFLLGEAGESEGKHFPHLIIGELSSPMFLIGQPSTATPKVAIPVVVRHGSILKVARVNAHPVVAAMPTDLRPVTIPQEEG